MLVPLWEETLLQMSLLITQHFQPSGPLTSRASLLFSVKTFPFEVEVLVRKASSSPFPKYQLCLDYHYKELPLD